MEEDDQQFSSEELAKKSVKQLKEILTKRNVNFSDCIEKNDLYNRIISTNHMIEEKKEKPTLESILQNMGVNIHDIINNFKKELIPDVLNSFKNFALDSISESTDSLEFTLAELCITEIDIPEENIEVSISGNKMLLKCKQVVCKTNHFKWSYKKLKNLKLKDQGTAHCSFTVNVDLKLDLFMKIVNMAPDIGWNIEELDTIIGDLKLKTFDTKVSFIYNSLIGLFSSSLKNELQSQLKNAIKESIKTQ